MFYYGRFATTSISCRAAQWNDQQGDRCVALSFATPRIAPWRGNVAWLRHAIKVCNRLFIMLISNSRIQTGIWPPLKLWPQASNDLNQCEFIYGRVAAAPYFIGLVKSDEHSGDRYIAHSFAVCEGTQEASRKLHGIGLPSARSHS